MNALKRIGVAIVIILAAGVLGFAMQDLKGSEVQPFFVLVGVIIAVVYLVKPLLRRKGHEA